jgi:tRNA nucleotidyltransferase/poly(A) polymerase
MITHKFCNKCSEIKLLVDFHKDSHKKDGICTICKSCKLHNVKVWKELNPEKVKKINVEWYRNNKNNPEFLQKRQDYGNRWRKEKPHLNSAKEAKRRAAKLNATPSWLKPEDLAHIKRTYKLRDLMFEITGIKYHVDHIVPLKGKDVCGLHVPWNLRVISEKDNLIKGNRYD